MLTQGAKASVSRKMILKIMSQHPEDFVQFKTEHEEILKSVTNIWVKPFSLYVFQNCIVIIYCVVACGVVFYVLHKFLDGDEQWECWYGFGGVRDHLGKRG